jgi:energy-coupling factor transport system permease protein
VVFHTLTWLAWLAAAAYLALVNQQPLQSALLILATALVFQVASRRNPLGQSWRVFLRLGLWAWMVALLFNLFSSHAGNAVFFTLPRRWPLIGGPITLEALLYGLASGGSLFTMLLVFAAFNLAADQHRLLRWIPAGLFQAGLVVSIALAFVPQMVQGLQQIREAQRIRGFKLRGLRDLIPLFVPLVTTGLERSLTLAESIEARGFGGVAGTATGNLSPGGRIDAEHKPSCGRATPSDDGHKGRDYGAQRQAWQSAMTLVGLLAVLGGLVWQAMQPATRWAGWAGVGLGVALVVAALYQHGKSVRRTHYRRELWQSCDTWVVLASAASIALVSYTRIRDPLALSYYPYPPFSPWPRFAPLLGLATLLIAAPAFLWPSPEMTQARSTSDQVEGQA